MVLDLLPDTERRENMSEQILVGPPPGHFLQRTPRRSEIGEQQLLGRAGDERVAWPDRCTRAPSSTSARWRTLVIAGVSRRSSPAVNAATILPRRSIEAVRRSSPTPPTLASSSGPNSRSRDHGAGQIRLADRDHARRRAGGDERAIVVAQWLRSVDDDERQRGDRLRLACAGDAFGLDRIVDVAQAGGVDQRDRRCRRSRRARSARRASCRECR